MTGAISMQGVGREFRRRGRPSVHALQSLDLEIPAGSRFGVVGESGSGKTTLLRLIAGLDRPTSGRILLDGADVTAAGVSGTGRLQVVFQDPMGSLNPRMRIRDIVAEPLRAGRHRPDLEIDARVDDVLRQVDLDPGVKDRYPHQFSGGQRQRISIARAIAPDPEVLLADEAVSALDVTVRATVLDLLDRITADRGLTLVFVSHDLSVIRRVCDRVAVLRNGALVETGAVEQVWADPQQAYTRDLLAAVPTLERALAAARARAHQS